MVLKDFTAFIEREKLFSSTHKLLVGVSGGMDSMVLMHLCNSVGFSFSVAHCNFQLRGKESDDDESFVSETCLNMGIACFVAKFTTAQFAAENKLSIQAAARQLRYEWFEKIRSEHNIDFILTAHHADDNAETILMNFFRGSGIAGLKGIVPKQKKLVRPLLFCTKEAIQQYVNSEHILYREDSSNASDKYTRNYYRSTIIPAIENIIPGAKQQLYHHAQKFRDINVIYDAYLLQLKKKLLTTSGNDIKIPVAQLLKEVATATVLYEIANDYGFTPAQLPDIENLLSAETGKFVQSPTHRIFKNRKWLIITPLPPLDSEHRLIQRDEKVVLFHSAELHIYHRNFDGKIHSDLSMATIDARRLKWPLLLRKWKQGDYFYPLGMQKKKKLSRFFIDQKISQPDKEKIWVIESDRRIVWVVGMRIDDRFKITPGTAEIIEIVLSPQ